MTVEFVAKFHSSNVSTVDLTFIFSETLDQRLYTPVAFSDIAAFGPILSVIISSPESCVMMDEMNAKNSR